MHRITRFYEFPELIPWNLAAADVHRFRTAGTTRPYEHTKLHSEGLSLATLVLLTKDVVANRGRESRLSYDFKSSVVYFTFCDFADTISVACAPP